MRLLRWISATTAVLALTGCNLARACTLVGFSSRVAVQLPTPERTVTALCLDDVCYSDVSRQPFIVSDKQQEYAYKLTMTDPAGVEYERDGVVRTEYFYVNGKGCDPRTANATLVVDAAGGVTATNPTRF